MTDDDVQSVTRLTAMVERYGRVGFGYGIASGIAIGATLSAIVGSLVGPIVGAFTAIAVSWYTYLFVRRPQ